MSLSDKIEEIKRKPEHIRIRYVWISVFISMFLIVIIWFFSIQARIDSTGEKDIKATGNLQEQFNKLKDAAPSVDDLMKTSGNSAGSGEGVASGDAQNQAQASNQSSQSQTSKPNNNDNDQAVKGEGSVNNNTFPIAQ
jgi:hypothetical protein